MPKTATWETVIRKTVIRHSWMAAWLVSLAALLPLPVAAQNPPARGTARDTLSDSVRKVISAAGRSARTEAQRRISSDTAAIRARAEAAAPTAFKDETARTILERARVARMTQDSALTAYRAKATQRINVGLGAKRLGLGKRIFQGDNVAMIEWQKDVGVWVTPVGSRMVVNAANEADGDYYTSVSIPYFPGRESLWFPSSDNRIARTDINEREIIHPLARGSEAYYRYATGDSMTITLADQSTIRLRELRITARKPDWHLIVGTFWFDLSSGQLVRAAYRLSVDIDLWKAVEDGQRNDAAVSVASVAIRDSILREQLAHDDYVRDSVRNASRTTSDADDDVPVWVKALMRPLKAQLSGVTVEYALYEGRFWLPRTNSATMSADIGFMRVPVDVNEKYQYEMVNGDMSLAAIPDPKTMQRTDSADTTQGGTSVTVRAGTRSDTLTAAERSFRQDSIRAASTGQTCMHDSSYVRVRDRYNGALRVAYNVPCDSHALKDSPELPPVDASNAAVFDGNSAQDLLDMLGLNLQPAWAPEMPQIRTGTDVMRYNRIEGLSVGVLATQHMGAGYRLLAEGRIGHADLHLNGEFAVERSNGRRTVRGTAYHRLSASNPEWAGALTWGASMPALLYARDEGSYFRNFGFELTDRRESAKSMVTARLFLERQWTAGDSTVVNTFSIPRLFGDRRFPPNPISEPASLTGVSIEWLRSYMPRAGVATTSALRAEAATGTYEYGRGSLELSASRAAGPLTLAVTGSGGSSVGRLPVQRQWYMGGVRTVRGQMAATHEGTAFWLVRSEVGTRSSFARQVVFFDIGWAGARDAIGVTQPQRGVGFGTSILDGLFRIDFARGLYPNKGWRTDLYLQAPI